jgi:hypothetical protein
MTLTMDMMGGPVGDASQSSKLLEVGGNDACGGRGWGAVAVIGGFAASHSLVLLSQASSLLECRRMKEMGSGQQ